ncbi:HAMP domain-containing sensor histidine kinase [Clostridium sp.]|uniref:sensor histidine kinase n=1 Tax=Clostridium sp. TaxID=1506 RepID=UPI0026052381|nr:HAMP domain-containing sensor histidine kinase [Clostridium sp.]
MRTIKTKLFFIFMILMVSLVLGGIILNSIFLESYYIYKNKGSLVSVSEKIKDEYISGNEENFEYADMIQNADNINTIIVDKNYNVKYNSIHQKSEAEEKRISKEVRQTILKNEKKISKKFVYYIDEKNNAQNTKLVFISQMDNGDYIILKKAFKSIHDSVVIANEFYILAGCIVIGVGAVFILIFSKKITKPIIEMSKVAENISNLKFDKFVSVNSKDEIGDLGDSINKISDKLNKSINELKQDVERKKELIRNMSHELKTPIGIIKGYAEGLKYGVVNDKEKVDKYCTILVEECDRMDRLVKELLNYSMIEGGMVKLNITTFDVYEFISKIVERFSQVFIDKNITFNFNCLKDCKINGDIDMLEKAINNFITNAIDHVSGKKIISVNVEMDNENIRINVFNTGDNIPEKELSKIWDVCYKIDKARSRNYGGHGIGLSLVRLIAVLHNGAAKIENTEDGVIFSLEIPNL